MSDDENEIQESGQGLTGAAESPVSLRKRLIIYLAVVLAFGIGMFLIGYCAMPARHQIHQDAAVRKAEPQGKEKIRYWTCSMHPQIRMPQKGKCPICFMELVPVYEGAQDGETSEKGLVLSKASRELAEVETSPVEYRPLTLTVWMVGKIDYDETKLASVSAWVPGRIDKLYINFSGERVVGGTPLIYLYSPELRTAQEEFLIAHRRLIDVTKEGADEQEIASARSLKDAVRKKLDLWGVLPSQIDNLEHSGQASDHMTIYAPAAGTVIARDAFEGQYVEAGERLFAIADLSEVWAQLDAFEIDVEWLRLHQPVSFETDVFPGEKFEGHIAFINPVLDEMTRTIKVRVAIPNPNGSLKPGMFVRAQAYIVLDESGGPAEPGLPGAKILSIPATAPLLTGTRAVVYVEQQIDEEILYVGRQVELGPRAGDYYIVRSGLQEGERVVTRGSFKIDSSLQIQAKPSMMNPEGGGPAPGHQHGNASLPSPPSSRTSQPEHQHEQADSPHSGEGHPQ